MKRIDHVNIVVEDLARMTAFYRDALGLRVIREVTIRGEWIEAITLLPGVEADVVYLQPPTGPPLELIAYRSPEGSRPDDLEKPNTKGLRHLAFLVDDLDGALDSVRAAGGEVLAPVQTVPTGQVEFGARQKWIVYCRDPEGNLLEFCDYR
jgi:catechol 2,3-dioxygenase-like lactoylglutathione lyase family enzyme